MSWDEVNNHGMLFQVDDGIDAGTQHRQQI
jgi:hypothetical protein